MKRLLALAVMAALTACSKQPTATGPAVTTTPTEAQKPLEFEVAPLVVKADAVKEQDPAVLAGATWTTKQCSLDLKGAPGEKIDFDAPTTSPMELTGFFIDPGDRPAGEFQILLKGETRNFSIPAKTGWDRSDVATYFKMPQLANSGYDVMVDLANVAPGKYKVDFMVDRKGARYFCESGKNLIVGK